MYAVYREVHPPTGIEYCLECHFVDSSQKNLVVAATSVLRVFTLVKDLEEHDVSHVSENRRKGCRLVQFGEYHLHGNVQCMERVRLGHNTRDTLLLTFRDAKLSLVEYDPDTNDLKVVSLHQFEDDDIKGGVSHNINRPCVRSDPEGRCAAMLMYGSHLAVIPFKHTPILDDPTPGTPLTPGFESQGVGHSFTIDLLGLTEKVSGVKDFQFIHGYNSPTVFILFEPIPTWAGRITLRKDTCSIVALSLNLSPGQNSPVIWQLQSLPFDSSYCVPVPTPIGGMLIVGANTLLYMNQSTSTVGMALNSHTENSTSFALRLQSPAPLSMDCSSAVFIDGERLVATVRNGDIYLITLIPDGMKGVRNIVMEKTAVGVLASCICTLGADHVFLGSRLGNSLLLHCSAAGGDGPPPEKKIKTEDKPSSDTGDFEVYKSDLSSVSPSVQLELCDSLLNIAPIKSCTVGQPGYLSEEFMTSECDIDLVTVSGHGKNGALCVVQRGVRPRIVTTFELPGCKDMWTVLEKQADGSASEHGFLILSQEDSTMVLQTGQEITELDSSGFSVETPTVYAGNMAAGQLIVQVTTTGMRLLRGSELIARVALDMGGGVQSCSITDPYAVILLADGTLGLVEVQDNPDSDPTLQLTWPELPKGSKVMLTSAYMDTSGLFVTMSHCNKATPISKEAAPTHPARDDLDDEDELLYGDLSALVTATKKQSSVPMETDEAPPHDTTLPPVDTHWTGLYREDGSLEIYSLPTFDLVFSARNFSSSPRTLIDSGPVSLSSSGAPILHPSETRVSEVLLTGLGGHPRIVALIEEELVIYTAFHCDQRQHPSHLQLRFSKVHHEVLLQDRKAQTVKKQLSQQNSDPADELGSKFSHRLRAFSDVSGYSGVYVCGTYPHWIFTSDRGTLQLHPMTVDGPALSFAPFNNVNCRQGFLYFNSEGELRICVLPSHMTYDSPWPIRKVPTHCTVHQASYHMESKTHVVITSEQSPIQELPLGDDPDHTEKVERDDRFVFPMEDTFHLQLYSPLSWEPVPNTKHSMDRYERVVTCKVMRLRSQETLSGRKEYIVVGTTIITGEEFQCKGKIRIFEVIEVIPEPGKPLTKHKLKSLYNQEQKGTISALESVDGLILACMGQRIFMWQFKDNKDLLGMAFIDTDIYIHTAVALKNFILIGDISRSIQLLRYKENLRTLSLISRDRFPSEVYACDYLVDGQQLGFIASDSDQNIVLYQYQPETPESDGGLFLTRRGDFNVGSHVNAFLRVHCKSAAPPGASNEVKALMVEKRDVTFLATLDGGIGCILPVAEKTYRRLLMLQSKLVQGLPHIAGLNPKAFRMFSSHFQYLYSPQRNILDGKLLWRYPQLNNKEKTDFAKQIGTTPSQILEDLKEIDKISSIF